MSEDYRTYLRPNALPSVWCPGCGNGVVVKALIEAVNDLGWKKDDVVVVGGIGCSGRTPFILDFNTMHTLHGRALAFATGIKMSKPRMKVIVVMGDGDSSAIGGNHFIHACRRNIDLKAIVFNNGIYGQTGGQVAPTTPTGKRSTTTLMGSIEPNFDLAKLAMGAGAGFVARSTSYDFNELKGFIKKSLQHKGFSLVEVMTACPTYFGRLNDLREPYDMLMYLRDTTEPMNMDVDRLIRESHNLLPTGIFRDESREEYTELYAGLKKRALEKAGKK
ncbi:MAG TPA: 2-oxoacid:ferredoxin oxidoreductase subunit beta [Fimbriimonadaceae bacterium]|nr:2-oxoacid:ferredoxin oxidoreductase subunit beta [Fimbriimonadaceae bacterium]